MKKRKSTIIFILVLLVILILAGFVYRDAAKVPNVKKTQTLMDGKSNVNKNNKEINKKEKSEISSVPWYINNPIYKILGHTNKLSIKAWNNMTRWRESIVQFADKNRGEVFINGPVNEKVVALTFDDGPDTKITPKIVKILRDNNVNGSFFFIGEEVASRADVVKNVDENGNLVMMHSFTHPMLTKLSKDEIESQIKDTQREIKNVIGKTPLILRPPYGDIDDKVLDVCKKNNCKVVIWSIDTLDWADKDVNNIVKNVVNNVRPGEIILMHSNADKKKTAEALPIIISELKKKGYSFTTLDKMLNIRAYSDNT